MPPFVKTIVILTSAIVHSFATPGLPNGLPRSMLPLEAPSPDWESLIFWLSHGFGEIAQICAGFSQFYCLDSFVTQTFGNRSLSDPDLAIDPVAARAWFNILAREQWTRINLLNEEDPGSCCDVQTKKYMMNGLLNRRMSPEQYMRILTNYSNDQLQLNDIAAAYIEGLCHNVVMEVGFGPGPLRRDHYENVVEGAPYLIPGFEFGQLGNPKIPSFSFDYYNPGEMLTFGWFKEHIMCQEHPWICGKNPLSMNERKEKSEKKSGSKKGRRKRHQGNSASSSSINTQRRRF